MQWVFVQRLLYKEMRSSNVIPILLGLLVSVAAQGQTVTVLASSSLLDNTVGLTSDGTNLYSVGRTSSPYNIVKISNTGSTTLLATSTAVLSDITYYNNNLYVTKGTSVTQIDPSTNATSLFRTVTTTSNVNLQGIAFYNNNFYVSENRYAGDVLQLPIASGQSVFAAGNTLNPNTPYGFAFDSNGNLFIADRYGSRIIMRATNGTQSVVINSGLSGPLDLAFDANGNLFIANQSGNSILKRTPDGTVSTFLTSAQVQTATGQGFSGPSGLAFDASGNLYIADQYNVPYRILKVTMPGITSFSATSSSVCVGQPITFSATVAGVTGTNNYTISNGISSSVTGSTSTSTLSNTIAAAGNGTQSFVLSFSTASGIFSQTTTVTVNPAVTATITGNLTICPGGSTTLTAGGGTGFLWNTAATSSTLVANPASTTAFSVTVTSSGCSSTTSATVTVNPAVTATIAGNLTICPGRSTTLVASGGTGFRWEDGTTSATLIATPSSTTAYSVTVTNTTTGCFSTTSVTITVNPAVTATIAGNLTICAGSNAILTAGGGTNFLWSNGTTNNPLIAAPASTTTYSVTVTNSGGCLSSTTATVTVLVSPTVTVSPSSTVVDLNQTASFTANGASSYLWSNNTANSVISVSQASVGNYLYTVTGTTGNCSATATATLSVSALCPAPGSAINFTASGPLGSPNCSVKLTVTATGTAFEFTGPGSSTSNAGRSNSYVFSNVYRNAGTYNVFSDGVTLPGLYTLKVYNGPTCPVTVYTTTVLGTACP